MEGQLLVIFHMVGCPHCKQIVGEWGSGAAVSDILPVYEVESRELLCDKAGVSSFPTIWLCMPQGVFEYQRQERTAAALREWILDRMELQEHLAAILLNSE